MSCACPRHDVSAAGREATAGNAGFGMSNLPGCMTPDEPTAPEVIGFWRGLHDTGLYGPHRLNAY